jgi:hypothetical protein
LPSAGTQNAAEDVGKDFKGFPNARASFLAVIFQIYMNGFSIKGIWTAENNGMSRSHITDSLNC